MGDLVPSPSGVFDAAIALVLGDLVGSLTDRVGQVIDERLQSVTTLLPSGASGSLLDATLGVLLHVGLLGLGTKLAVGALPYITTDAASFVLYGIGISGSSGHLISHLKTINSILLDDTAMAPLTTQSKSAATSKNAGEATVILPK